MNDDCLFQKSSIKNQKSQNMSLCSIYSMEKQAMIQELDTVVLAHDIQAHGLRQGDIGAVVHCYDNDAYEVEFVTGEGETIAVLGLNRGEIRSMRQREILHVRELLAA